MKRIIIAIIALSSVFSNTFASDFFLDNIGTNETQENRMANIKFGNYTFANKTTAAKLRDSLYFNYRVKSAILKKYENGSMNSYEFDTLAEELETFTFFLDTYFQNMKGYEKTGRKAIAISQMRISPMLKPPTIDFKHLPANNNSHE